MSARVVARKRRSRRVERSALLLGLVVPALAGCSGETADPAGGAASGNVAGTGGTAAGSAGSSATGGAAASGGASNAGGGGGGGVSGSAGAAGGGGMPLPAVSYRQHVQPLLEPCMTCHFRGSIVPTQLEDPFDSESGLIGRTAAWKYARRPTLVVPGQPEQSFLIDKLKGTDLMNDIEGYPMPQNMPLLTEAEILSVRTWITNGALNDDQYRAEVAPIFGNHTTLGLSSGKCSFCHTASSPFPPDIVNPFDPERGVVNVPASLAGVRVVPGDPEGSVLFRKVSNMGLTRPDGEVMPYQIAPFTAEQIRVVEDWIRAGAKND